MEIFKAKPINDFNLPEGIARLSDLAYNLWWTWNPEAQRLFSWIDPYLWEKSYHNPVMFLRNIGQEHLKAVLHNAPYMQMYGDIVKKFDAYMGAEDTWFPRHYQALRHRLVAYFSTEFGLHETLPIYAGGLGVLSGDHIKEASDLGLPFVGIGFFYTEGYFSQHITDDGWQQSHETHMKFEELPVLPIFEEDGRPLTVVVELPGREVLARVWEIQVGRVPLYLLDTNVEGNSDLDRKLTAHRYPE